MGFFSVFVPCVCALTHTRLQDRSLYHVCTMTHFFHWDGIYITHQTEVSERRSEVAKRGGRGRGDRERGGRQSEICEFNYASIVFTVQSFFGNIRGPYVEPAASEPFKQKTATHTHTHTHIHTYKE